jgi:F-type H+-transporting ATPase subunit gamma
MAKARAILGRIHAVKNIAKITNTMQLIAQARFKVAHDRAVAARPYTDRLGALIADLTEAVSDFHHPLLEVREAKTAVVLAIASNRGLCGGYNSGVARALQGLRTELEARGLEQEIQVAGRKLVGWLKYQQVPMTRTITNLDDRPTFAQIDEIAGPLLSRYIAGEVDEVHVVYTKFHSSSRQKAVAERVLPLGRLEGEAEQTGAGASGIERDYIYSPDPESILSDLLPRRVLLHVFQAFLDAAVSEQTARMIAMRVATDNAYDVISDLTRVYNRSRQAQITTELSEIMGGAMALQ